MLIYALKDDEPVFIDDVENGKKCDCVCPSCGKPLIAYNNGRKYAHSFHHPPSSSCQYGYETSLHWAAKDILSKAKKMTLPPVYVQFSEDSDEFLLRPAQEISIDKVEIERKFESVIPDLIVYVGEQKFFVEIFVTHAIDDVKLEKLQRQGISTIEIDLSAQISISKEELSDILLKDSEEKTWRYNAYAIKRFTQYEASLCIWTRDILLKEKRMTIPSVYLAFPQSFKEERLLFEENQILIHGIELKKRTDSPIPYVIVYSGTQKFLIEFYLNSPKETANHSKISVLEIDLSQENKLLSPGELSEILLEKSPKKSWTYHTFAEEWLKRFYQVSDKRRIILRNSYNHVDYCPLAARRWHEKPYANVDYDCSECQYCISIDYETEELLCSGRERIATLEDFNIPKAERIRKSNKSLSLYRYNSFAEGRCPYCGHLLVLRDGKYGQFWGCIRFPHCTFKALINPDTGELIIN